MRKKNALFSRAMLPATGYTDEMRRFVDANEAVVRLSRFDWLKCRGNTLEEILLLFNRAPEPMRDMAASGRPSETSELPVYHVIPDISLYSEAIDKGQSVYYHKHGIRYAIPALVNGVCRFSHNSARAASPSHFVSRFYQPSRPIVI
jgi:hypothetical protein